jgi:hypothetical protein
MLNTIVRKPGQITPYAQRNTADLLYIAAVLNQREEPRPTDLDAALIARGFTPATINPYN